MQFQRFDDHYVLKLDPGEEAVATLCDFVARHEIRGGYFIAFGAFSRVRLRYFDPEQKRYLDHEVDRQVEVVSMLGNIAWQEGRPKLHIHGAFGDRESRTCSGHVAEGIVQPTLEVFLTRFDGELRRARDPATGLDLLALEPVESAGEELADQLRSGERLAPYTP